MSYIRSTSNPERLYVYCNGTSMVWCCPGKPGYDFPLEEWNAFIKETQGFPGKHGDFELKEVTLKYPTPKLYEKMKEIQGAEIAEMFFKESRHFKTCLYWKGKLICRIVIIQYE